MLWKNDLVYGDLAQKEEREAAGINVPFTGPVIMTSLFSGPSGSTLGGISKTVIAIVKNDWHGNLGNADQADLYPRVSGIEDTGFYRGRNNFAQPAAGTFFHSYLNMLFQGCISLALSFLILSQEG